MLLSGWRGEGRGRSGLLCGWLQGERVGATALGRRVFQTVADLDFRSILYCGSKSDIYETWEPVDLVIVMSRFR